MCFIKKCVFALIYAFKRFLSVQKMHSKPCLQWMIFLLKKGQICMLWTHNFQVFVKFVLDFLMCFAPRNTGKIDEFLIPKKLYKKTRKNHSIFAAFSTICVGKFQQKIQGFQITDTSAKTHSIQKIKYSFACQNKTFLHQKVTLFSP